jgi:hypothetical protein
VWVLARALCRYRVIDLSQVPAAGRAEALRLQLLPLSPFAATGHHAVWHGGRAMVWFWDQTRVRQAMEAAGLQVRRVAVVPETVLMPAPERAGLYLSETLSGVDGQIWSDDGLLLLSRWWPQAPDPAEWLALQRDRGWPSGERQVEIAPARPLDLRDSPQLRSSLRQQRTWWRDERLLYAALALALLVPTAWWGAGWFKARTAAQAAVQAAVAPGQRAQPLLQAREEALRIAARAQTLNALDPFPGQLEQMALLAAALPTDAVVLKDWDFRDGRLKVTLGLLKESTTSSMLVTALQQAKGLRNIQVAPGTDPRGLVITMEVQAIRGPDA